MNPITQTICFQQTVFTYSEKCKVAKALLVIGSTGRVSAIEKMG
jgi:hypothetical protein